MSPIEYRRKFLHLHLNHPSQYPNLYLNNTLMQRIPANYFRLLQNHFQPTHQIYQTDLYMSHAPKRSITAQSHINTIITDVLLTESIVNY